MAKKSFRDPATNVLKCWGYTDTNDVGDLSQDEAENFSLVPGKWQWDGSAWVVFTPPPKPDPKQDAKDKLALVKDKDAQAAIQAILDLL